jgi:hypothetical protein
MTTRGVTGVLSAFVVLTLGTTVALAASWNYSFGADVVEVEGTGAQVSSFISYGGPSSPGFVNTNISRAVYGDTWFRVRVRCAQDEWGSGAAPDIISAWRVASDTRRVSITCPSNRPFVSFTKVQGASQTYRFRCKNWNDPNFGNNFFSCSSFGEW